MLLKGKLHLWFFWKKTPSLKPIKRSLSYDPTSAKMHFGYMLPNTQVFYLDKLKDILTNLFEKLQIYFSKIISDINKTKNHLGNVAVNICKWHVLKFMLQITIMSHYSKSFSMDCPFLKSAPYGPNCTHWWKIMKS